MDSYDGSLYLERKEGGKMNTKIVTYTGKLFDLLNPVPEMVCIEDIAHSLSLICRYTGHTKEFYSVAQHCTLMAECTQLFGNPLARLLHDAAEAYIGDMSSPWKQMLWIADQPIKYNSPFFRPVKEWEQKIQQIIGIALKVDLTFTPEIEEADNRMYFTEVRDLMRPSREFEKWRNNLKPIDDKIFPLSPKTSEHMFLSVYHKLKS